MIVGGLLLDRDLLIRLLLGLSAGFVSLEAVVGVWWVGWVYAAVDWEGVCGEE
jgi:hypothetical protein